MNSLLIIATNKYIDFLPALVKSVDEYFLQDTVIHIFTDKKQDVSAMFPFRDDIRLHKIDHKPWPYATLYRFHFFQQYMSKIEGEYVYYVDADTRFVSPVDTDIIEDRVAVQHCGYVGRRGTYESNRHSVCYVAPDEGTTYYGGGFWGFAYDEFAKFVNKAVYMVNKDAKNGIIAVYHDESVINRYLIDNPPTRILSPSYHFPENHPYIYSLWGDATKYKPILLLLDKNHDEIRK